jgi:octopine/nopaline transport system permease protein
MTLLVAICAFAVGAIIGSFVAWAKIAGSPPIRMLGIAYTTVLRGVPDLLVIYLLYFGGSAVLTGIAHDLGASGFFGVPSFASATTALGIVSAAYQAEAFRGAYLAIDDGQIMAARSVGMHSSLMFRRIVAPQVHHVVPSIGNLWQVMLKESALVSVTGITELLHQATIGAGATYRPFDFYSSAMALYLLITWGSSQVFLQVERRSTRGTRRRE